MQQKNYKKASRNRGRPKKSALTPREQARIRKIRQRVQLAKSELSKIEIYLPSTLKEAVKGAAEEKSFSEIAEEALKLWLDAKSK